MQVPISAVLEIDSKDIARFRTDIGYHARNFFELKRL